jgi:hypothetical protein
MKLPKTIYKPRFAGSASREPRSIVGMIVTVRAALKDWPIIDQALIGSGTESLTMCEVRSSTWR